MQLTINESKLIEGIRLRNDSYIEYLYKRSYPMVSAFVLKSGGSVDDVRDLLQDCIVLTYENIVSGTFKERSGVVTYLVGISKNRWFSFLRRKQNQHDSIDRYADVMNIADDESMEDVMTERAKMVRDLLVQSTDRCKEILVAYYYDSLSMEQIAVKFDYTNADNAKNQKAKCMDKLRKVAKSCMVNEI